MPIQIAFRNLPAGYAESAAKGGDKVLVSQYGFYSSEDGDELINRLEGLPQQILSLASSTVHILPSKVDTLLAIIKKDKSALVYINEITLVAEIRAKRKIEIGDLVSLDHILDMGRITIKGVNIPDDSGVVLVFSVGWRKGFFYDLTPLYGDPPSNRDFDFEALFGSMYSYLTFQERFKIDSKTWESIFKQKWFPFSHLDNELIKKMISHVKSGWEIDDLIVEIANNVKRIIKGHNISKIENKYFSEHSTIFETAFSRFLEDDYISCISILYPRIEGFLRTFYRLSGYTEKPTSTNLSEVVIKHNEKKRISYSLLIPEKFHHYLSHIYFSNFAPGSSPDVGRHSVAHGEARQDDFNLKSSILAILTIYQLSIFIADADQNKINKVEPAH